MVVEVCNTPTRESRDSNLDAEDTLWRSSKDCLIGIRTNWARIELSERVVHCRDADLVFRLFAKTFFSFGILRQKEKC